MIWDHRTITPDVMQEAHCRSLARGLKLPRPILRKLAKHIRHTEFRDVRREQAKLEGYRYQPRERHDDLADVDTRDEAEHVQRLIDACAGPRQREALRRKLAGEQMGPSLCSHLYQLRQRIRTLTPCCEPR